MANSKDAATVKRRRLATVDTAPGASGYWTNTVNMNQEKIDKLNFSIMETGDSSTFTATVTLQWKIADNDLQDYDTYTAITRKIIEGQGKDVLWRAGVDNGDYTSGEVTFGFDW